MNSVQSTNILPYSYYESYNMNHLHTSVSLDEYSINDLEKQLPEYRCPYKDYIQIAISDESEDDDASEDEPDIENAIVRPIQNRYTTNDYYNSLISYYINMCNSAYTLLDFDFRD
jgi:hypothetical protein